MKHEFLKLLKNADLFNNSYIFESILIPSTLLSSAVCPLVKMQKLRRIR